ncbi:hypothetical protein HYQ45_018852 [Verticillium longisporum]|uniref:FAD-binding PCMH-type domain-containing protein n=1 Tax=Verticillium longisporum TaxID=100787 RepID=A0A8I3AUT4_VERLO|nr:hypothetical protein HYQ45_018852 [Verticillium longisporum]
MKMCHTRWIPVTGYSGGTSLEGHFVPTRGGVSIDFGRMDQILSLYKDDLDVVVQPGVRWEALNEELARDNLFFPPDPGPGAMIGGIKSFVMADSKVIATKPTGEGRRSGVEHVEEELGKPNVISEDVNHPDPELYIEALARYPNDESIDQVAEKKVLRKIDMRILPLLGICYFFYYVDKTTLGPIETPLLKTSAQRLGERPTSYSMALPRQGQPSEVAALIVFLLGDESKFITGSVYQVDGGLLRLRLSS